LFPLPLQPTHTSHFLHCNHRRWVLKRQAPKKHQSLCAVKHYRSISSGLLHISSNQKSSFISILRNRGTTGYLIIYLQVTSSNLSPSGYFDFQFVLIFHMCFPVSASRHNLFPWILVTFLTAAGRLCSRHDCVFNIITVYLSSSAFSSLSGIVCVWHAVLPSLCIYPESLWLK